MSEPVATSIVCRNCGEKYHDEVGTLEDERLQQAVNAGVFLGDWSGLLCAECNEAKGDEEAG